MLPASCPAGVRALYAMFVNIRDYLYQRRRGLATAAGVVGAVYLAGRYILERLEEVREQVVQEKTAREK